MKKVLCGAVAAAAFVGAAPVRAQDAMTTFASPIPDGAETRFCYHAGLAYSENALVTIDIPFRRESPTAVQKRLLRCVQSDSGENLVWVVTSEERTPGESGN